MDFLTATRKQLSDWAKLGQKKYRREFGQFLIDGTVCVREALKSRMKLDAILVLAAKVEEWEAELTRHRVPVYGLNSDGFSRISRVESSQGIVAVGRLFSLPERVGRFAVACEQVSDPGNCGALIRVCDFFGASMLYLGGGSAEIWNEKVVRGSMGSLFHQPIKEHVDLPDLIKAWKGTSAALISHGGEDIRTFSPPFTQRQGGAALKSNIPTLLVLGHESRGLDPAIAKSCNVQLTLNGGGSAESLNLVTAAAVGCYALTAPDKS